MRVRTRSSLVNISQNPVPRRLRRGPRDYSYEDKVKCVALYASEMSLKEISETTRIPFSTVRSWKYSDWWEDELGKVRMENEALYRARAHQIIDRTTKAVIDRLDNGDSRLMANGTIVKVPVPAKDAAIIGAVYMDKLRVSLNMPNVIHGTADGDRLLKLAEKFAQIAGSKTVIEGRKENPETTYEIPEQHLLNGGDSEGSGLEDGPSQTHGEPDGSEGNGYLPDSSDLNEQASLHSKEGSG